MQVDGVLVYGLGFREFRVWTGTKKHPTISMWVGYPEFSGLQSHNPSLINGFRARPFPGPC